MASGEEMTAPKIIYNLRLEWLWRLRFNTSARLKRLLVTFIYSLPKLFTNRYLKEFKLIKQIK